MPGNKPSFYYTLWLMNSFLSLFGGSSQCNWHFGVSMPTQNLFVLKYQSKEAYVNGLRIVWENNVQTVPAKRKRNLKVFCDSILKPQQTKKKYLSNTTRDGKYPAICPLLGIYPFTYRVHWVYTQFTWMHLISGFQNFDLILFYH